jgi:hypothetical protein
MPMYAEISLVDTFSNEKKQAMDGGGVGLFFLLLSISNRRNMQYWRIAGLKFVL